MGLGEVMQGTDQATWSSEAGLTRAENARPLSIQNALRSRGVVGGVEATVLQP